MATFIREVSCKPLRRGKFACFVWEKEKRRRLSGKVRGGKKGTGRICRSIQNSDVEKPTRPTTAKKTMESGPKILTAKRFEDWGDFAVRCPNCNEKQFILDIQKSKRCKQCSSYFYISW